MPIRGYNICANPCNLRTPTLNSMNRILSILLVLIVVVAAGIFGVQSRIPSVTVAEAREGTALDAVSGNVEVLPVLETTVKSERNGIVKSVITLPADSVLSVEVGDELAQLNTDLVDSEIALAQLQLDNAKARLEAPNEYDLQKSRRAEELESLNKLQSTGRVSESEIERVKAEIERLTLLGLAEKTRREQEIALRENELKQRELWKRQHTILAPTPGTLNAIYIFPGDILNPGSQVAKIHSHELLIRVSVREEDFLGITHGNQVSIRFLAFGSREFDGTVSGLSPTANADSRQRDVFVKLENPPEGLVSGMTGQAIIVKDERTQTLTIPRRALVGQYVYAVDGDTVELRKVETGYVSLDRAEILSGLELGEAVIVDRPHIYRDGEKVKVIQD